MVATGESGEFDFSKREMYFLPRKKSENEKKAFRLISPEFPQIYNSFTRVMWNSQRYM